MRSNGISIGLRATLTIFTATLFVTNAWAATEKKLHNFGLSGSDGTAPYYANLIFDAAGNLYGTTYTGGAAYAGTVFELTPNSSGGWTEKKLHNFYNNAEDGTNPQAGLVFDAAGNLYGTTYLGGDYGVGTVFELTPNGSGGWTETKLHNFSVLNTDDGYYPSCTLIFDGAGNLYGTTYWGGDYTVGTVFEITPNGSGGWTETKLHNFGNGTDGAHPYTGLIFDGAGNLYGTTSEGGDYTVGTAFEMTPNGSGGWTETKLHNFSYTFDFVDGAYPYSGVIFDGAGNLYGTTTEGGDYGLGTVFEITP